MSSQPRSEYEVIAKIRAYALKLKLSKDDADFLEKDLLPKIENLGLLDDSLYAKNYVAQSLVSKKNPSSLVIKRFLAKKGISRELIQDALASYPQEIAQDFAYAQAKKKFNLLQKSKTPRSTILIKKKIFAYLQSKGFQSSVIVPAIDRVLNVK
ncbi:RecX family transcriptional regulator [Patescibacteria group bacterium]|nr:RecX family transcriptional regulator [Patescibacteria group bacterium]